MPAIRSILPAGAVALAALVAMTAFPGEWADGARTGAMFSLASPDRWLAIVALGLALGAQDRRVKQMTWLALTAGVVSGVAIRHSAVWPLLSTPPIFRYARLLGPAACLLSGLALLAGDRWRSHGLPLVAFVVATGLWFTAAVNDPTPEGYGFVAGFSLAYLCLALAAASLRGLFAGRWITVGERIAGSWLLTIGCLLSATQLFPAAPPVIDAPPPPVPSSAGPSALSEPDFVIRPDAGTGPRMFGSQGLPRGTN